VVERTVQFWHVTDLLHEQLSGRFPVKALIHLIEQIPTDDPYVETLDGVRLLGMVPPTKASDHLVLCRVRSDNLPSLERKGLIGDLDLADDQNIAEATHFRFFGRNVVGMLYNHDGPRIGRLEQYIERVAGARVAFSPVLDADTARRLDQLRTITSVTLSLPVDRAYLLPAASTSADDVPRALREMANVSLAKTVHVRFVIRGGRQGSERRFRDWIRSVITSSSLGAFKKFEVRAQGQRGVEPGQTVDFVQEQLSMKAQVRLRGRSRTVTNESAHSAIDDAYSKLQSEIELSVSKLASEHVLTLGSLAQGA
jgi:hypothetical protein